MRQQGIAAIGLPFGGGADHHGNLLALGVCFAIVAHWKTSDLCAVHP
jgi:hypothetical protein